MDDDFENDDWLEGGAADDKPPPRKGEIFTKARLANIIGVVPMTMDRWVKEGAPVEARGARKAGWRINSADFIQWMVGHKVAQATGSDDLQGFEAAKTREKEATAKLKELTIEEREGRLVSIAEVTRVYERELGIVRAALLAVPSRLGCDREIQDRVRDEIMAALSEITGVAAPPEDAESAL